MCLSLFVDVYLVCFVCVYEAANEVVHQDLRYARFRFLHLQPAAGLCGESADRILERTVILADWFSVADRDSQIVGSEEDIIAYHSRTTDRILKKRIIVRELDSVL